MTPPHAKTWSPRGRTPVVRVRGRSRRRISIAALTCYKPGNRARLIYRPNLPPYAPDLNPVEGIWSLLRRGWLSSVAFSTPEHLVQTVRRGLRHIQYRSHLIDGCLTETGLTIPPA
ncbi:transposase [Streptomyces sp. M10(2022)]